MKFKPFLGCLLVLLPLIATPAAAGGKGGNDPLVAMFVWWNQAFREKEGFTPESFGRYFTKDAVMKINGKERVRGVDNLAVHFRKIQGRADAVEIKLPFIEEFRQGNKIFTYHYVTAREGGKDALEHVMGYAEIKDGKIALIDFLSVEETDPAVIAKVTSGK